MYSESLSLRALCASLARRTHRSLSLLREYWLYVTAVVHRAAHAVIACASRDSLDRAYRFISRFFIAPATRLTRLVYDADAASR